jgi:hypothetical protein
LLTEIGGWEDWVSYPMSSSARLAEPPDEDASAHHHHHREASSANSLSVPDSTRVDTLLGIAGTTSCSPIAPPFAYVH